jgi:transposase-like protein
MSKVEIPEDIAALARKVGQQFKSEQDLADFSRLMKKITVAAALGGEIEDHLGYAKHEVRGRGTGNSRNGYSRKTLKGDHGAVEIDTPRDRNGTYEPQIVKKGQTRLTQFEDQILTLYAKGMSTRDIVTMVKEMYDAEVSATLISKVTDAVLEWQARPLDEIYPIVYLDCIVLKIRQDKRVINKAVYLALGVNLAGQKELLGLWLAETEGAKFWLSVLTELQQRGVKDIFISAVDGLSGFPEAISTVYPHTRIQLSIVHLVRNSLKFVSWKERKIVAADLKKIYGSVSVDEAERELLAFAERWDGKYPSISKSWQRHWPNLITLFD